MAASIRSWLAVRLLMVAVIAACSWCAYGHGYQDALSMPPTVSDGVLRSGDPYWPLTRRPYEGDLWI